MTVSFFGQKLLFTEGVANYSSSGNTSGEVALVQNNRDRLNNVVYFRASACARVFANSNDLLDSISCNGRLFIAISAVAGLPFGSHAVLDSALCNRLVQHSSARRYAFLTTELYNGKYSEVCGDLNFTMTVSNGVVVRNSMTGSASNITLEYTRYYKTLAANRVVVL